VLICAKVVFCVCNDFVVSNSEDGNVKLLTKGDNNSVDDRGLYAPGQLWIRRKEVVGRARGLVF